MTEVASMWYSKRKMTETQMFPQGIIIQVHETGWMTEDLVKTGFKLYGFT
jgi:hypothetical protein